jgi:hypothetical protein
MEDSKIGQFMFLHSDKFSDENLIAVNEKLKELDGSKLSLIIVQSYIKPSSMFWISFFLGGLGIDRFMLGQTGFGAAKLCLGWATCFVWPLVDCFFFIKKATKAVNFEKFTKATMF